MSPLGTRKNGQAIVLKLALTDPERRILKRFMYRVLEDLDRERRSYRVHAKGDVLFGRLVDFVSGEDLTIQNGRDEIDARALLRRLR